MRVTFTLLCWLVLIISQTNAQQPDTIYLWPGKVPGTAEAKQQHIISENNSGDVIRIAEVTNPMLLHFPANHQKLSMIICPGGAYQYLAVNKEGSEIAAWLNGLGITAYVLYYRVPNKKDGALMDLQRAIRLVKSMNTNHRVGVMGFSAGGSLAARAACPESIQPYEAVDENDTISPLPHLAALIYPAYLDEGENRQLSPGINISDFTPPIFIFGTADDPYGHSALVMASALRDNKKPVDLHFIATGGHGYGLRSGNNAAEKWPEMLFDWLSIQHIKLKK